MSGSNIEELGKMLNTHMKNVTSRNTGITVELGTINANMALTVASLGNAIPKGDYMLSLHLKPTGTFQTETTEGHTHTVTLPDKLRGLKAGDRVIVAWVGTEPIVVDIVVSS